MKSEELNRDKGLSFRSVFAIRREEWPVAAIVTVLLLVIHYFFISRFFDQFMDYSVGARNVFLSNFHMAGFDPTAYDVVTHWQMGYDILRHPLLAWMMWPLYIINQWLWQLTGCNCVQFIVGFQLFFCAFYSAIFMYRILTEHVCTTKLSATLLTSLFFTFAYIMVSAIVPDHFCLSLFMLLLTIYILASFETTPIQQAILYTITAGITLTNGVVVFIADLIFHGRKTIMPKRLALAYVVPTLLLIGSVVCFQRQIESTTKWVEQQSPRTEIVYENMLGESIQFHRKHILGDVLWRRPVIVRYLWWGSYAIEVVYCLLFAFGIWFGRRERMLWMMMAVFAFTLIMHIVCGFAANEVQIMTAHWAFVIPITIGYLARRYRAIDILIALLAIYLLASNFYLLHRYLTWPLAK